MSLFGTYVQESVKAQEDKELMAGMDINVEEAANEVNFLSGVILAEASAFDSFVGIQESVIPTVFEEAVADKAKDIKEKIVEFLGKVQEFFAGLITKLQEKVMNAYAKVSDGAELKKDVEVISFAKTAQLDAAVDKAINIIKNSKNDFDALNVALTEIGNATQAGDAVKLNKGQKLKVVLKAYVNAAQGDMKRAKAISAECKALASEFKSMASKDDEQNEQVQYAKAVTSLMRGLTKAYRHRSVDIVKSFSKIIGASLVGEKKEKKAAEAK